MNNHDICELQDMIEEQQIIELVSHTASSTASNNSIYSKVSI
jgi:hypothetical protein